MRFIVTVPLALALALAAPAQAARFCGAVFTGGVPVRHAHVIAVESGAVTTTDSTGRFCLDDLPGERATVRVFAIGYAPEERLITLSTAGSETRIELTPLRGGGGWSASGAGTAEPPAAPAAEPVAAADTLTELDAGGLGVPLLYLDGDSVWIRDRKHKGKGWEQLVELRRELHEAPAAASAAERVAAWKRVAERAGDLRRSWCVAERPVRNALSGAACAFVERARLTALVRASASGGGSLEREPRRALERLQQGSDAAVAAWARRLLERSRAGS